MIYFLAIIPFTDMYSTPSSRRGLAIQSRLVNQMAEAGIACLDAGYNRVPVMAYLRQS